jgi:hypothetical protein
MKLMTGNKHRANHNGRIQSPRLQRKQRRTLERYQTDTWHTPFQDPQRDTNESRHSGNVIRDQGEKIFKEQKSN